MKDDILGAWRGRLVTFVWPFLSEQPWRASVGALGAVEATTRNKLRNIG